MITGLIIGIILGALCSFLVVRNNPSLLSKNALAKMLGVNANLFPSKQALLSAFSRKLSDLHEIADDAAKKVLK